MLFVVSFIISLATLNPFVFFRLPHCIGLTVLFAQECHELADAVRFLCMHLQCTCEDTIQIEKDVGFDIPSV